LLDALSGELGLSLGRFARDSEGVVLAMQPPCKLQQQVDWLAQRFQQVAPPPPPLQQRLDALARLRRGEPDLSRRDWALIAWGLCDDCGASGKPLDEQPLFDAVMRHTDDWIERRDVPRKGWFGLLNSYFSYDAGDVAPKRNWLRLRGRLVDTLPILVNALRQPKLWSWMLEQHHDIFSDDAGRSLRQVLFYGSGDEQQQLTQGLPIPESSWLWRRVVAHQIEHLNALDEAAFLHAVPGIVAFLRTKPLYADDLLAALLTRYCQSGQRGEPHELLKNESFARWGNPQLRGATRWAKVEAPVRAMVLRWFAKEDLEHFFSLLQGAGQVDQARLRYWLRFVDQISYTRILLGSGAVTSQDPEFRNFRTKNAGRYGHLIDPNAHNNAFIMRINDHYFVEFSGTGNACYAYEEKELPFDPGAHSLRLTLDLKKRAPTDSSRQAPTNRILHNGSWEPKADAFLARRGIRPGTPGAAPPPPVKAYRAQFAAHGPAPLVADAAVPPAAVKEAPPQPVEPPALTQVETRRPAPAPVQVETRQPAPALVQVETRQPAPALVQVETRRPAPAEPPAPVQVETRWPGAALLSKPSTRQVVRTASELARINRVKVQDNLDKGGAFWVLTSEANSVLGRELAKLGMTFHTAKGYWIK
jgi:hypothetical protein